MRLNTQSGYVSCSHSSACGRSSRSTNDRIDSRSCSCSSVKMKCRRWVPKSGFGAVRSAVGALMDGPYLRRTAAYRTWGVGSASMTVRYEVDGAGVATVALDQPDTRNALSDELLDDLIGAFEMARDDDAVRCVVLTSTHERVFSSGGNLKGFAADAPLADKFDGIRRFPELFTLIGGLGKPTLCA